MNPIYKISAPSNIALLKYWGKIHGQFAINPSLSFTLSNAETLLSYSYTKRDDRKIVIQSLMFEGKPHEDFKNKLEIKFESLFSKIEYPFGCDLFLETENTFPHSSGIASSASSMAAMAKMFAAIFKISSDNIVSSMARELSGSACRSINYGWHFWGESKFYLESNQQHAVNITKFVHPGFHNLQDWIFICSNNVKGLSSSDGHKLMENHRFLSQRIQSTQSRLEKFVRLLKVTPNLDFFELVEEEALELHALMMTSNPPYILMEPKSLAIMKKISLLRKQGIHCGYTLDAGSAVHLLFPKDQLGLVSRYFEENYFGHRGQDFVDVLFDECRLS